MEWAVLSNRAWPLTISVFLALVLLVASPATSQEGSEPETETLSEQGYCTNPQVDNAGSTWQRSYWFEGRTILSLEATLSWSDDESGVTAVADSFRLNVREGGGTEATEDGSSGSLYASIGAGELDSNWTVTVQCLEAGRAPGPLGMVGDAGNGWTLEIVYTYHDAEAPGPSGPMGPPPNIAALYDDPLFWTHVIFMIASTYMFGLVGGLAAIALYTRNRWREDPNRFKRALSTNRPFRVLAVHTWMVFFIAAVPLGMYVAGSAYGWENAWTSFPAVWNPWFYDITNADHVSSS
jgi:hypothetical protein